MSITLKSSAFANGEKIPKIYTCEGKNISPPLTWSGAPVETQSFVLVCEDPDAPSGLFCHWAVYDIPADWTDFAEGYTMSRATSALHQGTNSFGKVGYGGPCPPRGHGPHRYIFHLYALSTRSLPIDRNADCATIKAAAKPFALDEAQIMGMYEKP